MHVGHVKIILFVAFLALGIMSMLTGHTTSLMSAGAMTTIGDTTAADASTDTMEKTAVKARLVHVSPSNSSMGISGANTSRY